MEEFMTQLRQYPHVSNIIESVRNEVLAFVDEQIEAVASGERAAQQLERLEALRERVASFGGE